MYDLNNDLSQTKAVNHKFHLSYVELKKSKEDLISSVLSRYDNSINRNFTVNYDKSKYTHLPARDADFTGDLSRSSIHANDSFIENWINEEDYIFWNIHSLSAGKNNVSLYYTLAESSVGTQLTLEFMNNKITKNIINSHDPELEGMGDDRIKRIESYTKKFKKILKSFFITNLKIPIIFGDFFNISFAINFFLVRFESITAFIISFGTSLKLLKSCFVSLGKQYPPYPKEGLL